MKKVIDKLRERKATVFIAIILGALIIFSLTVFSIGSNHNHDQNNAEHGHSHG